jgi:hypothetical protein
MGINVMGAVPIRSCLTKQGRKIANSRLTALDGRKAKPYDNTTGTCHEKKTDGISEMRTRDDTFK